MASFFNRTPMFDRFVIWWGSKCKHHKDTCLKEIGHSCYINNLSTLNNEHNCGDLCIHSRNQQTCTSNNSKYMRRGLIFNPIFVNVIVDVLMQLKFDCVNIIGRGWRTWKQSINTHKSNLLTGKVKTMNARYRARM